MRVFAFQSVRTGGLKTGLVAATLSLVLLSGCRTAGDIDPSGGITAIRTACPSVGVPVATGDMTLFDPPASRDAAAIDVTAVITNVRSTCVDVGPDIQTTVTFDVRASRIRADAARDVSFPYFVAVLRGGTQVTSKRIGRVTVHFDAGQTRGETSGQATTIITRAAATLPEEVRKRLTQRRRAGNDDAAIDPLSAPEIREAVRRATFEALVGFQLTDEQLRYNATR